MANEMFNSFFVVKNELENTYRIECKIVIYRNMLGKHPDFITVTGNEHDGFYTKYWLLINDDIPTQSEADEMCNNYNKNYNTIISEAEHSGDWSKFPFKDRPLVYYK